MTFTKIPASQPGIPPQTPLLIPNHSHPSSPSNDAPWTHASPKPKISSINHGTTTTQIHYSHSSPVLMAAQLHQSEHQTSSPQNVPSINNITCHTNTSLTSLSTWRPRPDCSFTYTILIPPFPLSSNPNEHQQHTQHKNHNPNTMIHHNSLPPPTET